MKMSPLLTAATLLSVSVSSTPVALGGSDDRPTLTADDIQIRDPFVVTDAANGRYLLLSSYFVPKSGDFGFLGTGAKVYETRDLKAFKPAKQVLDIPKEYGCKAFWAPEMHCFRGKWYVFGTINYERGKAPGKGVRGTWSFVSDSPEGPFKPTGNRPITPVDWNALDGTFWEEDGKPYMVFCHEWTQIGTGEMCLVRMTDDLSAAVGEPKTLFKATDYTPTPAQHRVWDKVTDGPFLYRSPTSGKLYMIWANVRRQGYAEIVCESASGKLAGPWTNFRLLFERDGGHGMLFRKLDGSLALTLHQPNRTPHERARFFDIEEADGSLRIRRAELPPGRFAHEMPRSTNLPPLVPDAEEMLRTFRDPFGKVRTGCYWYWLAGNISCEGAQRDLEAMKRAGIDLAYIGDIKDGPSGKVRTFSPEWNEVLQAAFRKASELDIELGIFNSPGWSQSGGPWVRHTQAMRRLAQGETRVTGPKPGPIALPLPDLAGRPTNEWQDVAVIAYPVPQGSAGRLVSTRPFEKGPDGKFAVEFKSERPFTAQSVRLNLNPGRFSCTVRVEAFKDGRFQSASGETLCSRINNQLSVGFLPSAPGVGTFAPVTATRFRVVAVGFWKGGPGNVASVELLEAPGVSLAYEKSLARMYESTLPPWGHYQWPDEPPEAPGSAFDSARAVVLTDRLGPDGRLAWDVPAGEWAIFRYVMTPTGTQNAPANPEATGYEVDKLSATHVAAHFDSYMGRILDRTPPASRRAIAHTIVDSYEQGGQNATDDFAARFKASFGYDPTPYYPACFGMAVASRDLSDRFLWDLRRFVADEVAYSYVGGLRAVGNRRGLKLWLENYGHWGFPGEFLQYGGQADGVGGEFWSGGRSIDEVRAAASCAHTYGKREVWCESHTSGGKRFDRGPMDLKSDADWHFSEGVNATVLHVYVQQDTERAPGNVAWFGNEFNRHNTWFDHFDLFTGYMKRAGYLLRLGRNVADVAYFIGEDAPKMTGLREPQLPAGRQYDFINAEVLCETAGVDDGGRLVLPGGTRYEVLVLPPQTTMRPKMVARLEQLVRAGAWVLGPKPVRSPSLADYPAADAHVREIADRLWGEVDGKTVKSARRDKGTIAWGLTLDEVLAERGSAADVIHDGRFCFAHRTLPQAEIYFIATRDGKRVERAELSFRTTGRIPEIWDAATGEVRPVESWHVEGQRTVVSLSLAERESAFVMFGKDAKGTRKGHGPSIAEHSEIAGPWTLNFQSDTLHRGPKDPVRMERLRDLSASDVPEIKFYSGKVVYRSSFDGKAAKPGERLHLELGDVAVTAKVKVNGKAVGGVCFAPYRLDVTDFVRDGKNELEVEVCTRWVNRLAGDNGLPNRPTWTSLPVKYSKKKLIKSGLVGPVRVVRERSASFAGNPIVGEGEFLSDPSAKVGPEGRLWVFGSRDESASRYCSRANDVLSTSDMRTWTPTKDILRGTGKTLYAPDALWHDGKWWLFFCTPDRNYAEGVASADRATGPFTGAKRFADCNQIDPSIFRDDDGTLYYTFGQFSMKMAKLRPDMSGIDRSTLRDGVIDEKNHNFHEGSQLFKRGDTYYLTYADIGRRKTPTCIGYATAKSPFGPYTYRGVIVDNYGCDPKSWNNHGGVFEFGGKWYVFYHRSTNASKMFRKTCVEPIEFDENGLIREVEMTSSGVGGDLDPYSPVEARLACVMSGNVRIALTGDGQERLAAVRNGDTATWRYFDFKKPATGMTLRLVPDAGGTIVLKGSCGETYGEVSVPAGDGKTLSEVKMDLEKPFPEGRAGIILEFSGKADAKRLFDIDEFAFSPSSL